MTVEEAIKILQFDTDEDRREYYQPDFVKAHEMAISALEKQVGKKPNKLDAGICTAKIIVPSCAICGNPMFFISIETRANYCQKCGQAICWED